MSKQSVLLFLLVAGASAAQSHFGNIQSSKTKGGSTSFKAAPQSEEYRKLQASNDNVCAAEPICLNTKATYSTIGATVEDGEADQIYNASLFPSTTVWYQFHAPQSGCVTITGCKGDIGVKDQEMAVYEVGSCSDFTTFTEVGYNDDAGAIDPYPQAYFYSAYIRNLTLTPGALYYIQVDSVRDQHEGLITLSECTAFEDDFRLCSTSVAVTTNCTLPEEASEPPTAAPSSSPTMDADPCEGKLLQRCMCVTSRNRRRCRRLAEKGGFECTTGPSGLSSCFCKPKQPKRCAARILRRKFCRGLTTAQKRTLAGAFEMVYKENCT